MNWNRDFHFYYILGTIIVSKLPAEKVFLCYASYIHMVDEIIVSFFSRCHKPCDSLFSNQSGFHNYRGLLNDCILLLVRIKKL